MKTIGIIGGFSIYSTLLYYQKLHELFVSKVSDLSSPNILIHHLNTQMITEFSMKNKWDQVFNELMNTANGLIAAGANILIIPCNTLHKFSFMLELMCKVPVLSIIESVGDFTQQVRVKKILLLGSFFTMNSNFYKTRLVKRFELEVVLPSKKDQLFINQLIFEKLCHGDFSLAYAKQLYKLTVQYQADAVVLGCTELSLLPLHYFNHQWIDALSVHVNSIVQYLME